VRAAILMLSANVGDFRSRAAMNKYHHGVLGKPFDVQQLLDQLQTLLKLKWIYEGSEEARGGEPDAPVPVASGATLSGADIAELRRLGRIGHVKAINAKLDAIGRASPEAAPIAARLHGYVHRFDLRRYMAALEEIDRHDP
jgi:hypothetical protein